MLGPPPTDLTLPGRSRQERLSAKARVVAAPVEVAAAGERRLEEQGAVDVDYGVKVKASWSTLPIAPGGDDPPTASPVKKV